MFPDEWPAALFAKCRVADNCFKSTKCHVRAGSLYGIIGLRLENLGCHTSNSDRAQLSSITRSQWRQSSPATDDSSGGTIGLQRRRRHGWPHGYGINR
jgi:hypothetical protein